jgi:hypothetical protein
MGAAMCYLQRCFSSVGLYGLSSKDRPEICSISAAPSWQAEALLASYLSMNIRQLSGRPAEGNFFIIPDEPFGN